MSMDYAGPLRVAAQFWVSVILLFVLLNRQLISLSRGIYLELERDIVLKRLSVREIEQRFTEEALGKSVANWLTEIRARLNAAHSKSIDIFSRIAVDLNEVEGIDRGYCLERQGRARKIEQKYEPEFKEVNQKLEAISEQLNQFGKVSMSVRPSGELRVVLNEWRSDTSRIRAELDKAHASLVTRFSAIYNVAAGNSHP
jgi:DNA repair ATPase RecN